MSLKIQLLTHFSKVPSNCQDKFACHVQMTIFHTLVFIYNSLDTQNHSLLLIEFIAEKIGVDHVFYSTVQCNRLLLSGY